MLSATSRMDCICIIVFSLKLFSNLTRAAHAAASIGARPGQVAAAVASAAEK